MHNTYARAVALLGIGATAAGLALAGAPAHAAPATYDGWVVQQEALGSQPTQDSDFSSLYISATGDRQHVTMTAGYEMSAEFSAPAGESLEAGQTFVARSDSVTSASRPGLMVERLEEVCGGSRSSRAKESEPWLAIGTFTVRQATYDGSGAVTAFAVTFEQNCQDTAQPVLRGSLAADATDVPVAVPAASPAPEAVGALAVTNTTGEGGSYWSNATKLTWTNPVSNWAETFVGYGGGFSWRPTYVGGEGLTLYRGTGTTTTIGVDGIDVHTAFRVIPISPVGRLGPVREVAIAGTRMPLDISRRSISMGGSTVLTGRLLESIDSGAEPEDVFTGPPLVGHTVEVYSRPLRAPWNSWRFLRRATTGPGGRYTVVDRPNENTAYEVRFRGTPQYLGNASYQDTSAMVAPQVDLAVARGTVPRGNRIRFSTAASAAGSLGLVTLQRFDGRTWRTMATKRIARANARAPKRIVFKVRAKASGRQHYRVVKPGDARHVHGYSRTVSVKVR